MHLDERHRQYRAVVHTDCRRRDVKIPGACSRWYSLAIRLDRRFRSAVRQPQKQGGCRRRSPLWASAFRDRRIHGIGHTVVDRGRGHDRFCSVQA